jgi:hypothetical protein
MRGGKGIGERRVVHPILHPFAGGCKGARPLHPHLSSFAHF